MSSAGSPSRRSPMGARKVFASLGGDGLKDFLDRVAAPGAEVVGAIWSSTLQSSKRGDVGLGQIGNVDIVPDGGAVWRRVVATEHREVV